MEQFLPGVSIVDGHVKENSLRFNEIITQIKVPAPASGSQSAYFRMADRAAIDFPLASAAVAATFSGSTVKSAKIVLGHVATHPIHATSAESYVAGQELTESVIAEAAQKAFAGATPLTHKSMSTAGAGQGNAFRVYIGTGVVINALRSLPGAVPGVVPPTSASS
jgi:xanthine dehydrogenase YagS FAD-binding subunit